MATIRKRGSFWQVQVRRQGFPSFVKTFSSHADATAWARDKERAIDRAELTPSHRDLKQITLHDLLCRYEREITAKKRGIDRERFKLRVLQSHSLAKSSLDRITSAMIVSHRDDRLRAVTNGTVRRELAIFFAALLRGGASGMECCYRHKSSPADYSPTSFQASTTPF